MALPPMLQGSGLRAWGLGFRVWPRLVAVEPLDGALDGLFDGLLVSGRQLCLLPQTNSGCIDTRSSDERHRQGRVPASFACCRSPIQDALISEVATSGTDKAVCLPALPAAATDQFRIGYAMLYRCPSTDERYRQGRPSSCSQLLAAWLAEGQLRIF